MFLPLLVSVLGHRSADWYPVLGLIRPQAFGFSFMSLMSEDTISFTSSCRGTPVSRSFHRGSQRVKMTWKQNKPLNKNTVEPLVGTEMLCLDLSIVVYRPADNDWTSIVCGEPKCAQIIKKCVSVRFGGLFVLHFDQLVCDLTENSANFMGNYSCLAACVFLLNEKKGYTEIFIYLFQNIILVFIFFRDATIVPFWADTDTMLQIMLMLMFFFCWCLFLLLLLFIPLFCPTKKSSKLFDHTNSWNNLK